ncbi:PASTA domain-containing protein [Couchioplanes azureus]|uniref:PASTA domain-containing protein n=1 Tax=Couchioplanes caeruleus TaxID=56438 RepID=UPI001670E0AB|nr:PASTA domain-containing protein [Couchioplanes caeruleus]GGQ42799.1 hypothetical protein GCM10010166_08750 [Couchioplanes caeruleus subsp. azureus]
MASPELPPRQDHLVGDPLADHTRIGEIPAQPPPPSFAEPAPPPPRRRGLAGLFRRPRPEEVTVFGVAAHVDRRSVAAGPNPAARAEVLTLRIESFSPTGERRPPVAVEVRAPELHGSVSAGDRVMAVGAYQDGILRAHQLILQDQQAVIRGEPLRPPRSNALGLAVIAAVLAILAPLGWFGVTELLPGLAKIDKPVVLGPRPGLPPDVPPAGQTPGLPWQGAGPQGKPGGGAPPDEPSTASLPSVAGKSAATAIRTIRRAGFDTVVAWEPDDKAGSGVVIRTEPGEGVQLPRGTTVTVVVSSGRGAAPIEDFSDRVAEEAGAELDAKGQPYVVRSAAPGDVAPGRVVEQYPPAGAVVRPQTTITLFVAPEPTIGVSPPPEGG